MQILPLVSARSQTAATDGSVASGSTTARQQSALFASLLGSAQANAGTSGSGLGVSTSDTGSTTAQLVAEAAGAASEPTDQELMQLPVTREDLAALRDDLREQGFTDEELTALEQRASSESGMTWGEMMAEVRKKAAGGEESGKKEVSNDDTVQMLGLFGKLGFTAAESQEMVDALARGETRSVWSAVSAKAAELSASDTVSLASSELTTLARAMDLSEDGQARLAALLDKANAAQGLSGEGVATALDLLKNELIAQAGKANQALSEFREAASSVLADAWQRETGKTNAGLHQDDVAVKAAQIAAMRNEKGQPAARADVPEAGQGVSGQSTAGQSAAGQSAQGESGGFTALNSQAGPVAAEQAFSANPSQAETVAPKSTENTASQSQADKAAALALGRETGNPAGGQQSSGGNAGSAHDQMGKEGGWGEFWSKVRLEGRTATTASTSSTGTVAAMDALKTNALGTQAARTQDAALSARVARQVETGILRNIGQDAKQLTLILSPEEWGAVSVTLTVKDKEVRAVISADNAETAAMLQEHAAKIRQSLESQGLKVTKLDVQTSVPQDAQTPWNGFEQHNQAREQREALERIRSSVRLARQAGETAGESMQASTETMTARASGLDIFA